VTTQSGWSRVAGTNGVGLRVAAMFRPVPWHEPTPTAKARATLEPTPFGRLTTGRGRAGVIVWAYPVKS